MILCINPGFSHESHPGQLFYKTAHLRNRYLKSKECKAIRSFNVTITISTEVIFPQVVIKVIFYSLRKISISTFCTFSQLNSYKEWSVKISKVLTEGPKLIS